MWYCRTCKNENPESIILCQSCGSNRPIKDPKKSPPSFYNRPAPPATFSKTPESGILEQERIIETPVSSNESVCVTENERKRYSAISIVSFVLGLLCILVYWALPILPACALICGIVGVKKTNSSTQKGKGLAIAGIVLGVLYNLQIIIKLMLLY